MNVMISSWNQAFSLQINFDTVVPSPWISVRVGMAGMADSLWSLRLVDYAVGLVGTESGLSFRDGRDGFKISCWGF